MASQEHYFFLVVILRAKHGGILVIYSQANIALKKNTKMLRLVKIP